MVNSISKARQIIPFIFILLLILFGGPEQVNLAHAQSEDYRTYFPLVITQCVDQIPYQPAYDRDIELGTLEEINHQRLINGGLELLNMNDSLDQIARFHSIDMAINNFFSHDGSEGESPWTRYDWMCEKFTWKGEIIAAGYPDVDSVINGWMNSQGHHDLILTPEFTMAGVGYFYLSQSHYGHYWTVDFGAKASQDNLSFVSRCPINCTNETMTSEEGSISVTICE